MSDSEEAELEAPPIRTKSVEDLVRVVKQCKGEYAFLVGAGTSKPAGIPTSPELIKEWREEVYEDQNPDADFDEWVKSVEDEEMPEGWSEYGFWFEKAYPAKASRREYIRDLVEDETPSFGIIILASMMAEGYVPLALTPNFDDLLYDAFYLFLEDKPMLVDHDAIAPQLKLTDDRPTIVKLHGDYLYDNLKNTADETGELEENMQDAMKQALSEYGLVVVGYSGEDKSIMSVLQEEPISDYELFWCGRDDINDVKEVWGKDREGLSEEAESLLDGSENAYYVPIEGSEELFGEFWLNIDGFDPVRAEEIRSRADKRAEKLNEAREKRRAEATGQEEEMLGLREAALKAAEFEQNNQYEKAKEVYQQHLDKNGASTKESSEYALLHNNYAHLLFIKFGEYDEAEEHFRKAIELDPENQLWYYSYAYFLLKAAGEPDEAENYYKIGFQLDPEPTDYESYEYPSHLQQKFGSPEDDVVRIPSILDRLKSSSGECSENNEMTDDEPEDEETNNQEEDDK